MLPVYILSKYNIRPLNGALFQWRNNTVRLYSSSSDSSSDSDSDTEKSKSKKTVKNSVTSDNRDNLGSFLNNMIQKTVSTKMAKDTGMVKDTRSENVRQETTKTANATDLIDYVNNMMKERKLKKTIDVAMQSKKKSKNSLNKTKHMSYEKKLISAAENVASTLGGDKIKTTSDLLQKVLASRVEILRKEQLADTKSKEDISSPKHEEQQRNNKYTEKKSIIHTLLKEYNQDKNIKQSVVENSIGKQLLNNIKISAEQLQNNALKRSRIRQDIDLWNGEPSRIFENMNITPSNIPELTTWAALEQRELKALMTYPPANIFQELILWTEQGKLWKFPINNEQGMEEEQNIHFSEHVFMERHLKEWCPKSGPIRHFMELVCTGLSKNPYLTVQEKINHIMWYKDFFESKQDLLQELGAIQKSFPDKTKEIKE
ncbi:28S ribosomal protein S31, mitochondrial isoform X1 [Cataglyphis hispanica]|uniref:28S ribosomal protein S31, mitochondrial isoform X1 n=1 Tax=Cataglyphis hispanica TaxID=1086592 RepID=UPI00217FA36B|nr:28S ribosomal protein S31, mitochondrial isoform X1 [Cataglyphis hispanica]